MPDDPAPKTVADAPAMARAALDAPCWNTAERLTTLREALEAIVALLPAERTAADAPPLGRDILTLRGPHGEDRLYVVADPAGDINVCVWDKGDLAWNILSRDEFNAVVNAGAAYLAAPDPRDARLAEFEKLAKEMWDYNKRALAAAFKGDRDEVESIHCCMVAVGVRLATLADPTLPAPALLPPGHVAVPLEEAQCAAGVLDTEGLLNCGYPTFATLLPKVSG